MPGVPAAVEWVMGQGVKFYLESLGCPKNLVDAQGMARLLQRLGYQRVAEPRRAQVLILNTCGFVAEAREESLRELQRLASAKRPGQVLIAAGCLSQYWGSALADRVPGVNALLGTRRWNEIGPLLQEIATGTHTGCHCLPARLGDPPGERDRGGPAFARQGSSAYLKTADGCSAPCAFCAIPLIKGPAVSRSAEDIVADAVHLSRQGIKEIILVAQDTTAYGRDRGEEDALPALMQAILREVPTLHWLRLMYAYPGHVTSRLIEFMASDTRVCHYLDLPLQHAHPDVLRRMKRPAQVDRTRQLILSLRAAMPDLALRSTFIVGYPGETEAEFEALLDFVAEVRFDRLGVFTYSAEEGTAAATLPGPLDEDTKMERYERLMSAQQRISREINEKQVGRILEVLVEGRGDGLNVGRSYRDAPEVDGLVLFPGDLPTGEIVPVHITSALDYDLVGEKC